MLEVAVLIPCFNEAMTIEKVVSDCKAYIKGRHAQIFVYDNNSTDGTGEIAEKAGAVVRREYLRGKGNVIRRMFREIDAACYIMIDGDDTYSTDRIPEMIDMVLNRKVDMVIGDRLSSTYFTENKRRFHNFGNVAVRKAVNFIFGCNIRDIMTGLRAFSYNFVKTFPVLSQGFEIETEMTIHAVDKNMFVENCIVEYRDRPKGSESKLNTVSDGLKVIGMIMRLFKNYRPFSFFTLLTFICIAAAFAILIPAVLIPYAQTGLVENFPTLIVCGFIIVAALLSFYAGLILNTIIQKERREFEFRLQLITKEKAIERDIK
jgi:glycosyltransferase involved in cell wall biosynthesis